VAEGCKHGVESARLLLNHVVNHSE
jgi:hypothetical protein